MTKYKVTFKNEEGKTKNISVYATGIITAIEQAIRVSINVFDLSGWVVTKATEI